MDNAIWLLLSVLLLTSFVRIVTCISILRYGLGLYGAGFGIVVICVSLALSFYVASPYIEKIGGLNNINNYQVMQKNFKPFMEKNIDKGLYKKFSKNFIKENKNQESNEAIKNLSNDDMENEIKNEKNLNFLTFLFVISELRDAFKYGVLILLPFLIIDLLVMNIFMALGVEGFSYQVASLPIKLGVFVAVDGWVIISEKLINYYM